MGKIIDAEFEVVCGPLRVGDEHPIRKGWFYTGRRDARGRAVWFRPPRFSRRVLLLASPLITLGVYLAVYVLTLAVEWVRRQF